MKNEELGMKNGRVPESAGEAISVNARQRRRHSPFFILCSSFSILCCVSVRSDATIADDLSAGAATADITPPVGLPMWGYGARHDKPNEGVMDPLHANVLVLAVGDTKLAIVGLDLGRAPTRKSMAAIRDRVKQGAEIEHVFIVGSHTPMLK